MKSLQLLKEQRFLPFFITQFLGALNDNVFKNALIISIAFDIADEAKSGLMINLAAGLFILPFLLFSPVAGQISDQYDKAKIMRTVKIAEVAIMVFGAIGFYLSSHGIELCALFLMGCHSAFFGPAKYAILPQHLGEHELLAGNALVEMGTFLAILLGTLIGGLLAAQHDATSIAFGVITFAVLGVISSRFIPTAPPSARQLPLSWNPISQMGELTRILRKSPIVFSSVMMISWYWFFGATVLAQLPNFAKHTLHGDESIVTLLLATFAIAIGVGSFLCERLSKGEIELAIVPIGAVGLSVFTGNLYFIDFAALPGDSLTMSAVLAGQWTLTHLRVLVDLAIAGIFSSLFIVPLYALVQQRSEPSERSRVIAANNVFNSLFMVVSALAAMVLYKLGAAAVDLFFLIAGLNIVAIIALMVKCPEFTASFKSFFAKKS